jgi:hypothetical protein
VVDPKMEGQGGGEAQGVADPKKELSVHNLQRVEELTGKT